MTNEKLAELEKVYIEAQAVEAEAGNNFRKARPGLRGIFSREELTVMWEEWIQALQAKDAARKAWKEAVNELVEEA